MSTLSITKGSTYDYHSDKVFEYEHKGYMSDAGTNIKVLWNGTIKLTVDHGFRKNKEGIYDPKITEGRYETEEKKIDDSCIEQIKNIIKENAEELSTMGGLEGERRIMDGAYSYIFLGNDDINTNIKATFSNLWSYQKDMPFGEFKDSDPFPVYDGKEEKYVIAKNVTKIMNVFFKIKNILVENGIDEGYFTY